MRWFVLTVLISSFAATVVSAQSDTFTISATLTGTDSTPPTTPANVSATPVSSSQIDVTWDASTDNLAIGGYRLFRDGVHIATTTLLTYSDTGLTAETTYEYYVQAFDTSFNYSSTSATSTATTAAVPVATSTPTTTSTSNLRSSSGRPPDLIISDLVVDAGRTTATISATTNVYATLDLRWGQTVNYESGYVGSVASKKNHHTTLRDLSPGTRYELELIFYSSNLAERAIRHVTFTTEANPDSTPPPNVTNLTATVHDGIVELTWENPTVSDFDYVRVVSSDLFYPTDARDGWYVYEGGAGRTVDTRPYKGEQRYYTVFAYDTSGNRSSGAVIALPDGTTRITFPEDEEQSTVTAYDGFTADDLHLYQLGSERTQPGSVTTLNSADEIVFQISYEVLPEHLKTVVVTVEKRGTTETFSFLLAINEDRSAYEAVISTLSAIGTYDVLVSVYDYKLQTITRRETEFVVTGDESILVERVETVTRINWLLIGVLVVFMLYTWSLLRRRTRQSEDKVDQERV